MGEVPGAFLSDPILGLTALVLAIGALVAATLRNRSNRKDSADPLAGLFQAENFGEHLPAIDHQSSDRSNPDTRDPGPRDPDRRDPAKKSQSAVLRGRIDHLDQVRHIWGPETRAEAIAQVAQIMRAGVRKSDVVTEFDDNSFAILTHGADEKDADNIAKRLRAALGEKYLAGMGTGLHVSASFGVAAQREGESESDMRARANAALDAAQEYGEDQVITASDWEEVILLPAPDHDQGSDAAAA